MDIDGQREEMLENNQPINWFPAYVKKGRFAKTIEQAPDWNLSRDRFWATAMPVWRSESGNVKVIGSYAELKELSGVELEDYHRPWIDEVTFELDGETYTRIDKVIDCWFESGSMPFAQFHYPFENKEKFEANFPGDFIVEYVGQVRAWFYYVHAVNTGLFGTNAFKNVIVTGNVAGNDGRKMSKSYGNYTDPNELMDKFSADSLRFLLLSSPLLNGEDFALQDKEVGDVARKLSMVWNMYDFFTMYAEVDGWEYHGELVDLLETLKNPLDIWVVSRLHQLVAIVEKNMDTYNIPDAMTPILPFLDDASNWFVRRSRRRFWRSSISAEGSEDDKDKYDAYKTLHYVLVRLSYVLAPFAPFMAEELHHNLTGDTESIHLKDWLPAREINTLVMDEMETVRNYVNEGLSLRAKAGIKVRQPLASVTIPTLGEHIDFEAIILDELNVKQVNIGDEIAIDENITPKLKREGFMREVIRHVQSARKQVGLDVDDRIILSLETSDKDLHQAIKEHTVTIQQETLTEKMEEMTDNQQIVTIEGKELIICLKKM
jgi:isoleucyl-tRNA synthetase